MALCSTNKETSETRAPTRPAHPPRSVLAPSFSLCNSRRLGPRPRLEFPHDLRLGTSHRTPIRQCHVPALPFFALCNALSTAALLLCLPLADSPSSSPSPQASPPLELPPASARPGLSLHMCQVPAETRRPSPPPSSPRPGHGRRRCRRQSGSSFPTMVPLDSITSCKPPGVSPGDAVHWPKNLLVPSGQHHRTPFVLFRPGGTLSPQHQVIYQGPRIMIGVA